MKEEKMMSYKISDEVPNNIQKEYDRKQINMNEIVGDYDILFLCLDTLRYDAAKIEEEKNGTPILNRYGNWEKRQAPGNFTYPSHHAMFAGYLPIPYESKNMFDSERLFFPKDTGLGKVGGKNSFIFEGSNIVKGLEYAGYNTICIGGVNFFSNRGSIGKVFPSFFQKSYWNSSFSCPVKKSVDNQIELAIKKIDSYKKSERIFMYLNISAIHYPNYFYLEGEKEDNLNTHRAALRYVDIRLDSLFNKFKERNKTFVIACSDHGSCYGEDGAEFHGINNEIVNTVPYKHFIL